VYTIICAFSDGLRPGALEDMGPTSIETNRTNRILELYKFTLTAKLTANVSSYTSAHYENDMTRVILTCVDKLTGNQLSLPHAAKNNKGTKTKKKTLSRRTGSSSVREVSLEDTRSLCMVEKIYRKTEF